MIKHILGKNKIIVSNTSSTPYISPGSQSAGLVRWNTNMNELEVYDGVAWKQMSSSVEISLDPETEMILAWAKEKMLEERKIDELCKKFPGLERARANFEVFKRLAQSESTVPESI